MSAFLTAQAAEGDRESLFPAEAGGGVSFTQAEVLEQSAAYSGLYALLIAVVGEQHTKATGISAAAGEAIVRVMLVPLTHFFFDRALRLARHVAARPQTVVGEARLEHLPKTIEDFCTAASTSGTFNQWILGELARAWPLPTIAAGTDTDIQTSGATSPGFVNHLFSFPGRGSLRRLSGRLRQEWSAVSGAVGAISMVNTRVPLLDRGLYGMGLLAHIEDRISFQGAPYDDALRTRVLRDPIRKATPALETLLDALHWPSGAPRAGLLQLFPDYVARLAPSSMLEAAVENLSRTRKALRRFRESNVISGGMGYSTRTAFLAAACRDLQTRLIGMQHGGHYGYSDWHVNVYECEYALCDGFITWGWTRMPERRHVGDPLAFPLPSPWLSERAAYWKQALPRALRTAGDKPFDLLLMSNNIHRFPPAPSGSHSTVNHLAGFASTLRQLIEGAIRLELRILHKPYNRTAKALLRETLAPYCDPDFPYHQFASENEKGLTPALLARCRLVVWDQPGTGLLECLAAGLPTLVLWTRLFSSEAPWAREAFADLVRVGVLHETPATLLSEVHVFRKDPEAWIDAPPRREALGRFSRQYGWAEREWANLWRKGLVRLRESASPPVT